jgi:anti-sigma factor RsiW
MICDRAKRLFGACWDDELTQAERDWLEGHLAACHRCRTEYDELSRTLELTASLPRLEAAPDLVERVLARSRRTAAAPDVVGQAGVRWVPAAAAAAAAVLTVAGALLFLPHSPWRAPAGPAQEQAGVQVTSGPLEPVLVPKTGTRPSRQTGPGSGPGGDLTDNVVDHSEDVEFILDPVTLHRGRASVTRTGSRRTGVEGGQAVISF